MDFDIGEITLDNEIEFGDFELDYKLDTYTTEDVNVVPSEETQIILPTNADAIGRVYVESISDEYVKPSGTLEITKNGNYDVKEFLNAEVKTSGYDTSDANITENDVAKNKIAYGSNGKILGQFEMPKVILKYVGSGTVADNSFELYIDEDVQPYAFQTSNSTGWFNISKVVTGNNCKIINTRAFSSQQKCKLFDFRKGVTDLETLCFNNAMTVETKIVLGEQFKRVSGQVFYEAPAYVYCYSITPPSLGTFNFYKISLLKAIYVPDESVDLYKNATNWTTVADYIKPLSEAEVI